MTFGSVVPTMAGMDNFTIGDTVQITGSTMTGSVGTVVYLDQERQKYLVRTTSAAQDYFTEDEITLFGS